MSSNVKMSSNLRKSRTLAIVAGALTGLAGLIELVAGSNRWTGNKGQPTTLGLLTLLLAAIMGTAALLTHRSRTTGYSLTVAAGIVVPALVSLTTAGRFAIAGAIVGLVAGSLAVADARQRGSLRHAISHAWPSALVGMLAVIYLAFGVVAGPIGILGIVGAGAAIAAPFLQRRSKRLAAGLLVLGVIPFAVAAWWSVVIPVTAIILLGVELPQLLSSRQPVSIIRTQT